MRKPTPEQILRLTAIHYGLDEEQLTQPRRGPWPISWPRLLAMSIAYEQPHSCAAVGKAFNRHHTSTVYAHQRVADLCRQEPKLAKERARLRKVINGNN
jgi:chromosomal replication initiation ATPase DnaA